MHAAERALLFAKRDIALDQPCVEAVCCELSLAPAPSEKAPFVLEFLWRDNESTFELSLEENHNREP